MDQTELDRKLTAFEACASSPDMRDHRGPIWFTLEEAQFVHDAVELAWRMQRICRDQERR